MHIGVIMIGYWRPHLHPRRRPPADRVVHRIGRVARGIRPARRSLHQGAQAPGHRALLDRPADPAPRRGQRRRAGDERHRPREGLSERHQVHRHPGPVRRRGRQLRRLRTGHDRQEPAAARGRRHPVHAGRLPQAGAFRRAGDQARPHPGAQRAGDPAGRQRGRAEAHRQRTAPAQPDRGDGGWKGTVNAVKEAKAGGQPKARGQRPGGAGQPQPEPSRRPRTAASP